MEFNPSVHKLGTLCRNNHDYETSGLSLRYIKSGSCFICAKEYADKYSVRNREVMAANKHAYYSTVTRNKKNILPMSENTGCSSYLGIFISERILANIFDGVTRMPNNNPGFDFICRRNKKIDVKSACTSKTGGGWNFNISRNKIADYFLILAFDNRSDLNPIHMWLIPGDIINHISGMTISKTTMSKWDKYKLNIDEVVDYCDNLR